MTNTYCVTITWENPVIDTNYYFKGTSEPVIPETGWWKAALATSPTGTYLTRGIRMDTVRTWVITLQV